MNELKPEDVMRALECCKGGGNACLDCVYFYRAVDTSCAPFLIKDALALLREKDAEIERLKAIPEQLHKEMSDRMTEEVKTATKYAKKIARADAITEFALRLKSCEFYEVADQYDGMQYIDFCDWVDQIAKEMKGE